MTGGYKELENITADLGIEAWGSNLKDAFINTAGGLGSLISSQPLRGRPLTRLINIKAESLTSLLVQFLNEIIYLVETQNFLPGDIEDLKVDELQMEATLSGVIFDPEIHTINAHIKAATYHGLEINQEPDEVRIRVIFDV